MYFPLPVDCAAASLLSLQEPLIFIKSHEVNAWAGSKNADAMLVVRALTPHHRREGLVPVSIHARESYAGLAKLVKV